MKMFWAAGNILFMSYVHFGLSCSIPLNNFDRRDIQILSHPYRFMAPDLKLLVEIHHYEKRNTFNPLATAGFRLESSNRVSAQGSGRQTPNEPFSIKVSYKTSWIRSMKGNETSQEFYCL